jgi:Fic family protein
MKDWLVDVPFMTPLVGHIRFESIHPFRDGNGRTGRMLYCFVCKKRGITPTYYNADEPKNREAYYRLFDNDRVVALSNLNWRLNNEDTVAK